jgi:hypothetical protein
MAKNTGTLVVDTIKTYDDTDKYAVVNSSDIKGGHHVVDYDTDRNNLVSTYPLRTETGMLVTVRSSSDNGNRMTTYQLSGTTWVNYADYLTDVANIWKSGATGNIWYAPPSGNVGIGITGAYITGKLTVFGQSHFYGISDYRFTIDPTNAAIYNYDTSLLIIGAMRIGNNTSNTGLIMRPDLGDKIGINIDIPTTTLDINGKTTIREQLIIDYSATGGVDTWNKSGLLIKNNNVTPSEVSVAFQNISTGSNYWFTGLNESSIYQIIYGTSYAGTSFFEINTSGLVTINNSLTVNSSINLNTNTTLSDGTINVGTTSRAGNSVIRARTNDSYISGFEAYGNGAGTGYLYVGESSTYGGGVLFNGDDVPGAIDPVNCVLYYRRSAGVDSTVFYYTQNANHVYFNGHIYFNASNTSNIYHNIPTYGINMRGGLGLNGSSGQQGFGSGSIILYTGQGGTGGEDLSTPTYGLDGGDSGAVSLYTGQGGTAGGTAIGYSGDGGDSGDLNIYTGNGGTSVGHYGGSSGNINMYTGIAGSGYYTGSYGDIILQYSSIARGNVLIATNSNPSNRRLKVNGIGEATDWIAISDIREKENIISFDNALDKVMKLNPVYFNFINGDDKSKKIGLIAQEVEVIIPELIPPTIGDSTKGVSYNNLSAVLVKAIQEQNLIIDNLKEEIEKLKTKIN